MKKILSVLLTFVLAVGIAACGAPAPSPLPAATATAAPAVVTFADPALEAWVRASMGKPEGVITVAEAEAVTRLNLSNEWQRFIGQVFAELHRVTKPNGWVAFEVGEVRKGSVKLEELVIPVAEEAGFEVAAVIINEQQFTKTANIWGTANNTAGTNTNRLVIAHKQTR